MAELRGIGTALPEAVVSNAELTAWMETSDEWIRERSGIAERRWVRGAVSGPRSNTDLAALALLQALNSAAFKPNDLDAVVYATISPDRESPGSGTALLTAIGCSRMLPVYEVRNACAGFIYALALADSLVSSGVHRVVGVVGVEVLSTGLDLTTRGRATSVLFGDGAGAVIVAPDSKPEAGIRGIYLGSDGAMSAALGIAAPSFCKSPSVSSADFDGATPRVYPNMDGKMVFKAASLRMPDAIRRACQRAGISLEQIALVVPHQANQRILDMVGQQLGCSSKVYSAIARYGNTTAASVPLALADAQREGRIQAGDYVCLVAFGAGFSWGACIVEWRTASVVA